MDTQAQLQSYWTIECYSRWQGSKYSGGVFYL